MKTRAIWLLTLSLCSWGCVVERDEPPPVRAREPVGYDYSDNVPRSIEAPGGLSPEQVPQFIVLGFDDNGDASGLEWALGLPNGRSNPAGIGQAETYDGEPLSMTFFVTSAYVKSAGPLWRWAYDHGHEIGNHSETHGTYLHDKPSRDVWATELESCAEVLDSLGIPRAEVSGLRAPFIATSDSLFEAARHLGFWYDSSIEEGFEGGQDGSHLAWPYTLDGGSYGNQVLATFGFKEPLGRHAGVWEMPVYALSVPPATLAQEYGVRKDLREATDAWDGQLPGLDYNLWYLSGASDSELLAILKYSLRQRLSGNHAPLIFTLHSQYYSAEFPERRAVMEAFIDHALKIPSVRIVSMKRALDWIRAPVALSP